MWGTKQSFHPPRNPGNFNQKSYYQKQGIHVGVLTKAEQVEIVLSEKDKNWIVLRWNSIRNQLGPAEKLLELEDCKPDGKNTWRDAFCNLVKERT